MNESIVGIAMFAVSLLLIFAGFPVAFTLAGSAMIFGLIGMGAGYFDLDFLSLFSERLFGIMGNQILLAVPYFVLMGTVLQLSLIHI